MLIRVAQTVLRAWNMDNGFVDGYFSTPKGRHILERLEQELNENGMMISTVWWWRD